MRRAATPALRRTAMRSFTRSGFAKEGETSFFGHFTESGRCVAARLARIRLNSALRTSGVVAGLVHSASAWPNLQKTHSESLGMSREQVIDVVNKQKIVQAIVHGQDMPRHDLVETLLQRQHQVELGALLSQAPVADIATALVSMPMADARTVWISVPAVRREEILRELPHSVSEQLMTDEPQPESDGQIIAFELVEGRLRKKQLTVRDSLQGLSPVWIDLLNSTKAERAAIGEHFGIDLPDQTQAGDLEVTSRFHVEDDDDIHLHSNFLLDREGQSRSVPVTFILHQGILFSIREEDLPVFRLQRRRAAIQKDYVTDCLDVLLDLYGADIEYSADSLEDIYSTLGEVGRHVLSEDITDADASSILADIAEEEDLNGRIRANIMDTQRAVSFLMRCKVLSSHQFDDAKQIFRNIESLNSHTAFLFDKINFLMDATIGFININQNKSVSQLTVFGVVFMPLNILAGIGGMSEFSMMTEGIPWPISYGGVIVAMALLGWATFAGVRIWERRKTRNRTKDKRRQAPA